MRLILLLLGLFIGLDGLCQQQQRKINFKLSGDTIRVPFNEDYNLIEDSCVAFFRYSQYDADKHILTGHFKDVSKQSPSLIITEGNYTSDGLKDGLFIARYLNGNLQSKGVYKLNKYDGEWELFYSNGRPRLTFRGDNGKIFITNMWNEKGKKTVDKGEGNFDGNGEGLTWHGKIAEGLPDGVWSAWGGVDKRVILREVLKKGSFVSGIAPMGAYNDQSRILLLMPQFFPYTNGEHFFNSPIPCESVGVSTQSVKSAEYGIGITNFNSRINELINSDLNGIDFKSYQVNDLTFECQIKTTGTIGEVRCNNLFDENAIRKISTMLRKLPAFKPATINGKPVTQMFHFSFIVNVDLVSYSYRLMPINEHSNKN